MARDLTVDVLAAIAAGTVQPFYLADVEFLSGHLYVWTGIGTLTWNSHSWLGVGTFGGVSAITQTADLAAENITLSLSGIPSDLVAAAIDECRQHFSVDVYLGFLDSAGAVVVDPIRAFAGRMDVPTIQDGGDTATISITAENPLIDLKRASERRYTHDDQQIDFPGDKGFQYVPAIQEWNGVWGKAGPTGNPTSGQTSSGSSGTNRGPQRVHP